VFVQVGVPLQITTILPQKNPIALSFTGYNTNTLHSFKLVETIHHATNSRARLSLEVLVARVLLCKGVVPASASVPCCATKLSKKNVSPTALKF
jgi:hypothetical protein